MNHSMCNTVRVLGGLAIVLSNETQRLSELLYWKSKVSFWESKIPNFKKWKTELRNSVSSWSMEEESESSRLSQSECVWWLTKCLNKTFQIENLDLILEILESITAPRTRFWFEWKSTVCNEWSEKQRLDENEVWSILWHLKAIETFWETAVSIWVSADGLLNALVS